jgi:hypothetical protein
MRKFYMIFLVCFVFINTFPAKGQYNKWYASSGGEIIFSSAKVNYPMSPDGQVLRFAPVLNIQSNANYDLNPNVGFFTGLAIRNVGFIYNFADKGYKKKFRNYNLGIPIGIKIGNLDKFHVYGGYEIEFPFVYKEKTFVNEEKTQKLVVWFSDRVPVLYNSVFVGLQFPYGANVKFKYYLTNFHNRDYTMADGTKPYQDLEANVFYISLSFNVFKNTHFYYQ